MSDKNLLIKKLGKAIICTVPGCYNNRFGKRIFCDDHMQMWRIWRNDLITNNWKEYAKKNIVNFKKEFTIDAD